MPPVAPPPLFEQPDAANVRLFCPAKVNLALSVGSPRDDGLHPIASWMVPVGFGDTLLLEHAGDGAGSIEIGFADDAPVRQPVDWPVERDLAVRALRAVERHLGRALPVGVRLRKRVPAGAGLGGGSADAAAMLDGLNRLFDLDLGGPALLRLAGGLGSDVVFQAAARSRPAGALVSGTGEVIEPLPPRGRVSLLLVLPPVACPTAEVYRAFDDLLDGGSRGADIARVRALSSSVLTPTTPLFNDLAEPACRVRDDLCRVIETARGAGFTPHVTGSGSTLFVVLPGVGAGRMEGEAGSLADAMGCAVVPVWTAG